MSNHVASELSRMLARQCELDPSTDAYTQLLRNMELLSCSTEMFDSIEQYIRGAGTTPPAPAPVIDFPPSDPSPFESALQPEEETDEPEGETYDFAEVRAALVEARRNGTNVAELLREFGVENFSAFPAGKYGELMARLQPKS